MWPGATCSPQLTDWGCWRGYSNGIKGYGKLKIEGTLEGTEVEVYGNLSITGYL